MAAENKVDDNKIKTNPCNCNEMYNGIQISFCTLIVSFDKDVDYQKSHLTDSLNIPYDVIAKLMDKNQVGPMIKSYIKASKGYIKLVYFYSNSVDNMDEYIEQIQSIFIEKLIPSDDISKQAKYFKLIANEYTKFETAYPFLCRTNKQSTNPFLCVNNDDEEKENNKFFSPIEIKEYPNQIIENKLYLGDIHQAYDKTILKNLKITHIINCTHLIRNQFQNDKQMNIKYIKLNIGDQETSNIAQHFDQTYNFINNALFNKDNDNRVFVHCHAGVSRSSTIVIAYLMKKNSYQFQTAFDYVKKCRQFIDPNPSFIKQLKQFQKELFNDTNPL